jgi:hypothetical protein
MLKIIVGSTQPQYPNHSFEVWSGDQFACYARSRLVAHLAKIEIEKGLKRLDERLRRYEADEPMTPLRQVYWNAARRQR